MLMHTQNLNGILADEMVNGIKCLHVKSLMDFHKSLKGSHSTWLTLKNHITVQTEKLEFCDINKILEKGQVSAFLLPI